MNLYARVPAKCRCGCGAFVIRAQSQRKKRQRLNEVTDWYLRSRRAELTSGQDRSTHRVIFELREHVLTLHKAAADCGVRVQTFSEALYRTYQKLELRIARAFGLRPEQIWPKRHRSRAQRSNAVNDLTHQTMTARRSYEREGRSLTLKVTERSRVAVMRELRSIMRALCSSVPGGPFDDLVECPRDYFLRAGRRLLVLRGMNHSREKTIRAVKRGIFLVDVEIGDRHFKIVKEINAPDRNPVPPLLRHLEREHVNKRRRAARPA